jgi:hypothetical protein
MDTKLSSGGRSLNKVLRSRGSARGHCGARGLVERVEFVAGALPVRALAVVAGGGSECVVGVGDGVVEAVLAKVLGLSHIEIARLVDAGTV